jgi:hypothetical protein
VAQQMWISVVTIREFLRYYLFAFFPFILALLLFELLVTLGLNAFFSLLGSQLLWLVVSYPLSRRAILRRPRAVPKGPLKWFATWLGTGAFSQGCMFLVFPMFREFAWLAFLFVALTSSLATFFLAKLWVFASPKTSRREAILRAPMINL